MKQCIILIIGLVLINSCKTENSNQKEVKETSELSYRKVKPKAINQVEVKPYQRNIIVAFEDSIPLLEFPSKESDTLGYLKDMEIVERLDTHITFYGKKTNDLKRAHWIALKHLSDTAWINCNENISFKLDIDTFNTIQIRNRIGKGELCGVCYSNTEVWNINTKNKILNNYLKLDYSGAINDSLYLFTSNRVQIYNTECDSFIYSSLGGIVCNLNELNQIFFLRWKKDTVVKYGYIKQVDTLCHLVRYDWLKKTEKILFVEKDIKKRPLSYGPDLWSYTTLKKKSLSDNLYLSFELYKMKEESFAYEFDTYKIKVDTSGNIIK